MRRLLFSVVVPTYNRPDILRRTLECLESQDCAFSYEVVVVSDNPNDEIPDLGFGRGRRRYWKLIRNQHNLGRAATRNVGIRAARGKYILFLDDDIWAEPQLLQAHYNKQKEIGGGVVVGAVPIAREVPHDIWNDYYRDWVKSLHQRMEIIKNNLTYHYFLSGNVSIPRELLIRVGMFDEAFKGYSCEDTELGYRLFKEKIRMVFCPDAIGFHYNSETMHTILTKYEEWGKSAFIFVNKHPELAEEISVAGIMAPGNRVYQLLLKRKILDLASFVCTFMASMKLKKMTLMLLSRLSIAYYAYGLKSAYLVRS